ncbi:MAG: heme-binding protein, partial [Terracidiphilus sp.]
MSLSEDMERIALQERELRLPRLDAHVAWELGSGLRTMALERKLSLVIDVRRFGQQLFYAALEGTTPDNGEWVRRKSNVVARFHRSSYGVGLTQKSKGTNLHDRYGLPVADYASDGG